MRIFSEQFNFCNGESILKTQGPGPANSITLKTEVVKISNLRTYFFCFTVLKKKAWIHNELQKMRLIIFLNVSLLLLVLFKMETLNKSYLS